MRANLFRLKGTYGVCASCALILFSYIFLLGPLTLMAQSSKRNVLFIIADDLNCDMSVYGHYAVKTPNLDKLAKQGLVFNNAYTNFPLCAPSRASFLTGLYPNQTGLKDLNTLVRERVPDVTTMPQNFMKNGYVAARVGKLFHYGVPSEIGTPGHDDPTSWNTIVHPRGRDKEEEAKIYSIVPDVRALGATLSWMASEGDDTEQTDGMVATESIKLLEQYAKDNKPFFLGVGFYRPHTPYVAPKKYFDMYKKEDIIVPKVPSGYLETLPKPAQSVLTRWTAQNNLSDSLARCAIQAYYASVTFMDAQLGRVIDALDKLGLRDNTIIVFTSDHGYHLGEHGYYQKMTLFENSDRVPLVISYPGQKTKGKTTNALVEMIDFYPTLSELAGLSYPEFVAGRSMVPVLNNNKSSTRKNVLTQIDTQYMGARMPQTYGYTLRTKQYRYTRWQEGGEGNRELYDRSSDPQEMKNLANDPKYKTLITQLDAELQTRIDDSSIPPKGVTVLEAKK